MRIYAVTVGGQPKGEAYKKDGRWYWEKPNRAGVEPYPKGSTIEHVRDHVAKVCNVWGNVVEFRRVRETPP